MTRAVVDSSVLVSALIARRDSPPSQVLRSDAVVHRDAAVIERATRDPRDPYLVALAKAAGAALVSSDRDLLEADVADLEILSARALLEPLA